MGLILFYFQADHLAANRTSENILKTVGSEKKVVGAQVLKKKSGDDAVQVSLKSEHWPVQNKSTSIQYPVYF